MEAQRPLSEPAPLAKAYNPAAVEDRIYALWEESGSFQPPPAAAGPPYVIIMPPPNVTGALHLGHASPPCCRTA